MQNSHCFLVLFLKSKTLLNHLSASVCAQLVPNARPSWALDLCQSASLSAAVKCNSPTCQTLTLGFWRNMQLTLLVINLLFFDISYGQIPLAKLFDELIHQLDVFHLLNSPRPAPTLRPLRHIPRPPARPRPLPSPRRPKQLIHHPTSKPSPVLTSDAGSAFNAWVIISVLLFLHRLSTFASAMSRKICVMCYRSNGQGAAKK